MSRRIIASGNAGLEVRQRGFVYQKGRKQSDPWLPTQRAYGYFRMDVPGQTKQIEVRPPLGFCRDRMGAMLRLRQVMQEAGVLDVEKIRERITPVTTFESQAAWWLSEIRAGRIVNSKTRKPMRTNTTDFYSNAVTYLNEVVGNNALALLDNPEARELVVQMKSELKNNERRFSDKTIVETFKVFKTIIASARDKRLKRLYPREWDLVYIGLPKVSKREQHRPTFTAKEIVHIIKNCKLAIHRTAMVLLAATGMRIAELLALEIGKHISPDARWFTSGSNAVERVKLPPRRKLTPVIVTWTFIHSLPNCYGNTSATEGAASCLKRRLEKCSGPALSIGTLSSPS